MVRRADLNGHDGFVAVARPPHREGGDDECQGDQRSHQFAHDRSPRSFPAVRSSPVRRRAVAPTYDGFDGPAPAAVPAALCARPLPATMCLPINQLHGSAGPEWRAKFTEAVNKQPDATVIRPVSPPLDLRPPPRLRAAPDRPGPGRCAHIRSEFREQQWQDRPPGSWPCS